MGAIDPQLAIRSVALAVSDLDRSASFYERALGLALLEREEHRVELGTEARGATLVLSDIEEPTPVPVASPGLYHVAWLHPSRAALASTIRRVAASGWRFEGVADHGVSEALYLSDPDGLGIEIYADRPRELWARPAEGGGVAMVSLPLDLDGLLAQAPGEPSATIDPGTVIGHIHLKVSDVPRAESFYTGALGFEPQAHLPHAAFVAAGGYHHHVGMNSWQSHGAEPAPDTAPGLRGVEFRLSGMAALEDLRHTLDGARLGAAAAQERDGALVVCDLDGQVLRFTTADR